MSGLSLDRVVAPGETAASVTDTVSALALRRRAPSWWWVAMIVALLLLGLGVFSAGWEFANGIRVWGNSWPVVWGFPIINYVWWIAIASGGTFISALFYLLGVEWRTSINRMAESMMLCAAACAGIYPILHLGRPWFAYWLFPYPNTMGLWPQFRSPLFWDFTAIFAYIMTSAMFWYLGLIPDLATLRDRASRRGAQVFYGILALGFRGTGQQWRHFEAVYGVLAALMAPLVVSVHSIVGLDFAGAQTVGWHSTQFPPFFVFGALLSGFATVIALLIPLRHFMRLHPYVTPRHIDVLGKLLLASSLAMAYSYVMDAFSAFYGGEAAEHRWFIDRISGTYASVYWATLILNVGLPQLLWWRPLRLSGVLQVVIALGVIVGMWLERFGIVVDSLHRNRIASAWGDYWPTFWDWSLLAGTVGLFLTLFLLTVRLLPVIAMSEMRQMLRGRS